MPLLKVGQNGLEALSCCLDVMTLLKIKNIINDLLVSVYAHDNICYPLNSLKNIMKNWSKVTHKNDCFLSIIFSINP